MTIHNSPTIPKWATEPPHVSRIRELLGLGWTSVNTGADPQVRLSKTRVDWLAQKYAIPRISQSERMRIRWQDPVYAANTVETLRRNAQRSKNQVANEKLIPEVRGRNVSIKAIQHLCAKTFKIEVHQIVGHLRNKEFIDARFVAIFLCRKLTYDPSVMKIGRYFNRDHTSIIHALRKTEARIASEPEYAALIASLEMQARALMGRAEAVARITVRE